MPRAEPIIEVHENENDVQGVAEMAMPVFESKMAKISIEQPVTKSRGKFKLSDLIYSKKLLSLIYEVPRTLTNRQADDS